MRLKLKDLLATLLMAAIAVPYIGFLVRGEMPPIEDPRGMAGTGLVFGAVALFILWRGDAFDRTGKGEAAMAVLSLGLGVAAYELSETVAADVLLAVFMITMALVWVVKLLTTPAPFTGTDLRILSASARLPPARFTVPIALFCAVMRPRRDARDPPR